MARHRRARAGVRARRGPDTSTGGDGGPALPSAKRLREALELSIDLGGHRWEAKVLRLEHGRENAEVKLDIVRDGESVGYASRAFFLDGYGGMALFHDSLEIEDEEHQGEGFGGRYARHTIAQARELGATHVILAAAHPGGGYAWARAGFLIDPPDVTGGRRPTPDAVDAHQRTGLLDLFDRARGLLGEQPDWPAGLADELDEIRAAIDDGQIATPFELAAWGRGGAGHDWAYDYEGEWEPVTRTEPMHAAKILLRASDWNGILLLR